jgi:hypothetical protein
MSKGDAKRKALEEAAAARKHVVQRGQIGFTYKPTPPSGPPPRPDDESSRQTPRRRS